MAGDISLIRSWVASRWGLKSGSITVAEGLITPDQLRRICTVVSSTAREGFLLAMDVSCHSFIRMARLAEPLMQDGGALFTMSYFGAERVVENYNLMGPVKAALEAVARYLAAELGPKGTACMRSHRARSGRVPRRASPIPMSCSTRRRRARRRAVW